MAKYQQEDLTKYQIIIYIVQKEYLSSTKKED